LSAQPDWWRTFFSGLVVDSWLAATPEEMTKSEVDFAEKVLGVAPPAKLLDVPCGGGRHSVTLAARGYAMTAVDISSGFLAAARDNAAKRQVTIQWHEREMRNLPWDGEFDGAFSLGNSFGYDTDAGNAAFLKAVARSLKPGGKFLLDTSYVAEVILPSLQERGWYEIGEFITLANRRYDHVAGRLEVDYTFIRGTKMERKESSARISTYRQICRLFEDAGFTELESYGSVEGAPFQFRSPRLLLIGTKR
jgi:SAM-dependent methyltransferase